MTELDLETILAGADDVLPEGHRSGLVCFVGRPNVGKSTLLNALVGSKIAITSEVPGTTRNTIRGVVTRPDAQVVFIDTPGVAKPKTLLTRRLNDLVRETWSTVDLVLLLVDGADGIGPGDRFLAKQLEESGARVLVVVTKEDLVEDKNAMLPRLLDASNLLPDALEIVPTAVPTELNVDTLLDLIIGHLGEGPRFFPDGVVTDQPERRIASEILREKLIVRMENELPHSIAVEIDEIEHEDDLLTMHAVIAVERDSQKGIVIGKGGRVLKEASTEARKELEALFGAKVFLTTHVKVVKEWQRNPKHLRRLGY